MTAATAVAAVSGPSTGSVRHSTNKISTLDVVVHSRIVDIIRCRPQSITTSLYAMGYRAFPRGAFADGDAGSAVGINQ